MNKQEYIFDSNIFIRLNRDLLPPDIWPTVWEILRQLYREDKWHLLSCVREEILKGNDGLVDWIKQQCFVSIPVSDVATINSYSMIMDNLVQQNHYTFTAVQDYAKSADSWIVAYAHAHHATIVTLEISSVKTSVVRIPDIADKNGAIWMDMNKYFRQKDIALKH